MTNRSIAALLAVWFTLGASPLVAQDGGPAWGVGPMFGFNFGDNDTEPFIGAAFRIETPWMIQETGLLVDAEFEYYFDLPPGFTGYALQGALLYPFTLTDSPIRPVAGSGLSISHATFDTGSTIGGLGNTDVQWNLIGGILVNLFFADLTLRIGDTTDYFLRGGVLLGNWRD